MLDLTLYILPSETKRNAPEKALESFGAINPPTHCEILDHRDLAGMVKHVRTRWYGYLFSCEVLDKNLRVILPYCLGMRIDLIVLCQRVVSTKMKYYTTPRFFRSHVDIESDSLLPKGAIILREQKITEGWLVNDARP